MDCGKNLLKTSLTEPKIQCLINTPLNNNLLSVAHPFEKYRTSFLKTKTITMEHV